MRVGEGIERTVVGIEDVDLVMAVGLGEEDAEIGVGEFEVDGLVGDLDDGVVPPGDALLLVQRARDALVEGVLEQRALAFGRGLIGRPAGVGDDGKQQQSEERDRRADDPASGDGDRH